MFYKNNNYILEKSTGTYQYNSRLVFINGCTRNFFKYLSFIDSVGFNKNKSISS